MAWHTTTASAVTDMSYITTKVIVTVSTMISDTVTYCQPHHCPRTTIAINIAIISKIRQRLHEHCFLHIEDHQHGDRGHHTDVIICPSFRVWLRFCVDLEVEQSGGGMRCLCNTWSSEDLKLRICHMQGHDLANTVLPSCERFF